MAIKYTEEQLNTVDKSLVIQMLLAEQEHTEQLTKQVTELNTKLTAMDEKMQKLIDQLILANKNRFGRSTEVMEDATQISFTEVDGNIIFFNEAEAIYNPDIPEPEDLEGKPKRGKKNVGKREQDLSGLETERVDHYLSECFLQTLFGQSCKTFLDIIASPNWTKLQSLDWQLSCQPHSHCRPYLVVTA